MRQGSWGRKLWEDFFSVFVGSTNSIRAQPENASQFGESLVTNRTPVIQLNSTYGVSALRDIVLETGSASVTSESGYIGLSTGATAVSSAGIFASEVGRYSPGYGAEIGIGIRVPVTPDGSKIATWGGITTDLSNALLFGISSAGLFVQVINGGGVQTFPQADWNLDTLDGNGPSGFDLDPTDGQIYQIDFTWYGYGQILFGIVGVAPNDPQLKQRFIPCHSFRPTQGVSLVSPNLSLFAQAQNGTDAEDFSLELGGRQYSIVGNSNPKYRFASDFRGDVSTSTTSVPLVTFRRKLGFLDRSVKIDGYEAIVSGEDHIIELRVGASLTGASFGTPTNHTPAETALESDTSATSLTGGIVVWQGLVGEGQSNKAGAISNRAFLLDIPETEPVTLCIRTLSGTGTMQSSIFRLKEEW